MSEYDIEKDTNETLNELARMVTEKSGPNYGFVIIIFPFDKDRPVAHYISNAARDDMVAALREKADILEAQSDIDTSSNPQTH